jgi:hypothetical protein
VKRALGWPAVAGERNGLGMVARYGFTGPEEWVQLDTSGNVTPADTKWVLRRRICLDAPCSRSIVVHATHWLAFAPNPANSPAILDKQTQQALDFMAQVPAGEPHILIGDLNLFNNTNDCHSVPIDHPMQMLRDAGYLDAWRSTNGSATGFTGIWNHNGCGSPNGNLYKRLDQSWSKWIAPMGMTFFGLVTPGHEAPSDHAGIIVEYALPNPQTVPPTVAIDAPAENAAVHGTVGVQVRANDDTGIARVELLIDGAPIDVRTVAPYGFNWSASSAAIGPHVLQAAATDRAGNRVVSGPVHVTVVTEQQSGSGIDEIVLHTASATNIVGNWTPVSDPTAAGTIRLQNQNRNAAKVATPLAAPADAFELTFNADAGKAYRLWVRGRAQSDDYSNDSVYVQFAGSVDAGGNPVNRIGTTGAATVILEDRTNAGLSGWGWADNGYGVDGAPIYFAQNGAQRLRVQTREDGVGIDQIVLSAVTYRTASPGGTKNDTTILPPPGSQPPPPPPPPPPSADEIALYMDRAVPTGNWTFTSDATAAAGIRLQNANLGQPKVLVPAAAPVDAFDLTFAATAGQAYRLWVRGRAQGNDYSNDSVYVQFDGSVDSRGQPVFRIGTTTATAVVIEDASGAGLSGWGWADNGYGTDGPLIYFATSGAQRLRVQVREDGVGLDQIVLSAVRFRTIAPGATKNDSTIVPR